VCIQQSPAPQWETGIGQFYLSVLPHRGTLGEMPLF